MTLRGRTVSYALRPMWQELVARTWIILEPVVRRYTEAVLRRYA